MKIDKLTVKNLNQVFYNPTIKYASCLIKKAIISFDEHCSIPTSYIPLISDVSIPQVSNSNIERLGRLIDNVLQKNCCTENEEKSLKMLIQRELYNIMSNKRLLGVGFHESVYRINDKYAAKVNPNEFASTVIDKDDSFLIPDNSFKELKTYFGGILARFGNFNILRNLGEHIPAGVPENIEKLFAKEYYRETYLPTFAKVPQESYNALLEDCTYLNKRHKEGKDFYCHIFDYINPNNIVLKDDKLYWVDNIRSDSAEQNATMRVLNMMLNKYGIGAENIIFDGFGESRKYAKEIFDKVIIAGAAAKLSFRSSIDMFSDRSLRNILQNLEIKCEPAKFTEIIETINKIEDKEQRVLATEKYLKSFL